MSQKKKEPNQPPEPMSGLGPPWLILNARQIMKHLVIAFAMVCLVACTKQVSPESTPKAAARAPQNDYEKRLVATRSEFRFEHWPAHARPAVVAVFEQLLADLVAAGESASESQKIECFKRAVSALNEIDRKDHTVIETSEAEQLIDIGNHIARAAGLDPQKYGDKEGPLSAGRNW